MGKQDASPVQGQQQSEEKHAAAENKIHKIQNMEQRPREASRAAHLGAKIRQPARAIADQTANCFVFSRKGVHVLELMYTAAQTLQQQYEYVAGLPDDLRRPARSEVRR